MLLSVLSIPTGSSIPSKRASTTMFPWSVMTGPSLCAAMRSTGSPPSASTARNTGRTAMGRTSSGTGHFDPSRSTSFDSSTMTMNRSAMPSTIFSRRWAAPRPLIRFISGSTSSAPSTAISTRSTSSGVTVGMAFFRACTDASKEVGMPWIRRSSSRTRRPSSSIMNTAVEPVPSPTTSPCRTIRAASTPTVCFILRVSSSDGMA